jgi:glycolate oxidase FAD binding subunit
LISSLSQQLAPLVGERNILPDHRLPRYAVDGVIPQAVVQPASREIVGEVLRWASSQGLAVVPWGGGTQMCLGNPPRRADLVLDLSRLNRLLDYQPADLTATVEAGITLEALQGELAAGGKLVPLEAPLARRATIGGILAAHAGGPLGHTYGPARDWLIGVSVVGADGVETKAGGKVVKNVTGYDLNKLYTGSLGTLGVIVEATFKLAPVPTQRGAVAAAYPLIQQGVTAAQDLLARVFAPQGIQVVNAAVARRLSLSPGFSDAPAVVLAHFAGRPRAVQRRMEESVRLLQANGAAGLERLEADASTYLLGQLTDLGWDSDAAPRLSLRVSLPPSAVADVLTWPDIDAPGEPPGIFADPGYGEVRLLWWDGPDSPTPEDRAALAIIARVREMANGRGGSAVVERCPLPVKQQVDVWGESAELRDLMRRIKESFDPSGVLNPGRFMGRL